MRRKVRNLLVLAVALTVIFSAIGFPVMPVMAMPEPPYNPGDIAILNAIIEGKGLNFPLAPPDGSSIPDEWEMEQGDGLHFTYWSEEVSNKRVTALWLNFHGMSGVLDVSGLRELRYLGVSGNELGGINLGNLEKLEEIYCYYNNLSSLDVSGCTNLKLLICSANEGLSLDKITVSGLENLTYFDCSGNSIANLDLRIPAFENLTFLSVSHNNLTGLDVSSLTKLARLEAHHNQLTEIDLSKLVNLTYIGLRDNQLTELDVSKNLKLVDVTVNQNLLTKLDLSMLEYQRWLNCSDNLLTELILNPNAFQHPEGNFIMARYNDMTSRTAIKGNNAIVWDAHYFWDDWLQSYLGDFNFAPQNVAITDKEDKPKNDNPNDSSNNSNQTVNIQNNVETQSDQTKHFGTSANAAKTWNAVSNEVVKLIETLPAATVETGFNHVIQTGADIVVPAQVFDTLKDTSATILMNTGIGVTFGISGGNVPDGFDVNTIDLSVRSGELHAPNATVRQMLVGTLASRQVPMKSREAFGMAISQHYNFGGTNADNYANLYRFNEQSGEFEYLGSYRINEKGQAMFDITGAADYLVTVTAARPNLPVVSQIGSWYTVVSGDSFSRIATRNGLSITQLHALNPQITNPNRIRVGQQIRLR